MTCANWGNFHEQDTTFGMALVGFLLNFIRAACLFVTTRLKSLYVIHGNNLRRSCRFNSYIFLCHAF